MLNQYLTNIFILKHNLNILYFNVVGEYANFYKETLLKDIKNIEKCYLKLGNLIKKIGGYPITDLKEIENIATLREISSKDYTANEGANILNSNFKTILSMNKQVFSYAIKKNDVSSISLTLEINNYLGESRG